MHPRRPGDDSYKGTNPNPNLKRAIEAHDVPAIEAALSRLEQASAREWAVQLHAVWDEGRADIALQAITPERLIDSMADGEFRLADRWVDWLAKGRETERLTDFARRLLRRFREIDEVAAGGLYVTLAHAIAIAHPGTAGLLLERRIPSVPEHWMAGHTRTRMAAGEVLKRLPGTQRAAWVRHLDEDDSCSTLDATQSAELVREARQSFGAESRAFSKLVGFGPTVLREACSQEHLNRIVGGQVSRGRSARARAVEGPDLSGGFRLWQIGFSLLAFGFIGFLMFRSLRQEAGGSDWKYQAKDGTTVIIGDPVSQLPPEVRPLYAILRGQGCHSLEQILGQVPVEDRDTVVRRLLLAYAQEANLTQVQRDELRSVALERLAVADQKLIEWHLEASGWAESDR